MPLYPPQIKEDRQGIEPSIRSERWMNNRLSHGTVSYKQQRFNSSLENSPLKMRPLRSVEKLG
jgi:hypothetical protein